MATIKAGTYRFNDVLTFDGLADHEHYQQLHYTVSAEIDGVSYKLSCDEIFYCGIGETIQEELVKISVYAHNIPGYPAVFYAPVYDNGTWIYDGPQTITIAEEQEVSAEFLTWFTANTVQQKQISGKWKFNNVLTESAVELYANVNFTVSIFTDLYQGTAYCDHIVFTADNESYSRLYNTLRFNVAELVPPFEYFPTPVQLLMYQTAAQDEVGGIWDIDIYGEGIKTIDFGAEPQTVSAEFYSWLTANATQPMASVSHNGEAIASLFPGQTATLKCAGMKMAGDVVVSVADNVGGGVCDKSHIIEVDKLPETGEDGAIYSTPELSAVALCVDGVVSADFAEESGMDAKYYTFASLPETGEQGDICYVESENELYMYIDAWYPLNMLLAAYGYPVRMKGAIKDANEIAEDGYYAVMGSKSLNLCTNGRYKTLITKGEVVYFSNNPGICYVDGIEPYHDSNIIVPSVSPDGLTVTTISSDAFMDCISLSSITLPDSVETIGRGAFSGCYALNTANLGGGLKEILSGAFIRCYSLKALTIPDSVVYIRDSAFTRCLGLCEVTIGSGIKGIGMNVFEHCPELYTIYFNGTMAQWAAVSKEGSWNSGAPASAVICTDGNVTL